MIDKLGTSLAVQSTGPLGLGARRFKPSVFVLRSSGAQR